MHCCRDDSGTAASVLCNLHSMCANLGSFGVSDGCVRATCCDMLPQGCHPGSSDSMMGRAVPVPVQCDFIASVLGLSKVGWVFTQASKDKPEEYIMSSSEVRLQYNTGLETQGSSSKDRLQVLSSRCSPMLIRLRGSSHGGSSCLCMHQAMYCCLQVVVLSGSHVDSAGQHIELD